MGHGVEQLDQAAVLACHLFPGVEHPGHVDGRLGDRAGQLEHHRQAALHVGGAQPPQCVALDPGTRRRVARNGVGVAGQQQPVRAAEVGAGHEVVAHPFDGQARHGPQLVLEVRHEGGLLEADRRDVDQFGGQGQEVGHRTRWVGVARGREPAQVLTPWVRRMPSRADLS